MKKNYTALLFVFGFAMTMQSQIVNIPDENFKSALVNTICANTADEPFVVTDVDTNDDGEVQVSEALAIQNLFVNLPPHLPGENSTGMIPLGISDLTGIGAFLNLKKLDISQNQLTTLDLSMLTQLRSVNCSGNLLTNLTLGSNAELASVNCSDNQLSTLDVSGLSTLAYLICHNNHLGSLDVSGLVWLRYLVTTNNPLATLTFGNNPLLENIIASENLFSTLDLSDTGIESLTAENNPNLTALYVKNGVVSPVLFDDMPFDHAAFRLDGTPLLAYICADADEVNNIIANLNGQPVLVTPYCNFTPGGSYNTIAGTLAIDCGADNLPVANQKVAMTDGEVSWIAFTNTSGHYSQYIGETAVTLTPVLEIPEYFSVTPESYDFTFTSSGNTETADFCAMPAGNHPDVQVELISVSAFRPGFDVHLRVRYQNIGTMLQSGNITVTFDDAILDYVSATPTALSAPNTLSWDFAGLVSFESREIALTLNLNSPVETPPVNIGDLITITAVANVAEDENLDNNTFDLKEFTVGATDPNDKAVSRTSIGLAQLGDYLYYTIRFQNVGNFYAENVVIKDILSENLDWATLQMVSASHPYRATLTSGNTLEWFFEGINLPAVGDDEPGSHGYVSFKIKPKNTLVNEDTIENAADIYFDFNWPVTTNTVTTTVSELGIHEVGSASFTIYPIPVRSIFSIQTDAIIDSILVYNALGQLVKSFQEGNTLDVSELVAGSYFIKIKSGQQTTTKTFIKL